AFSWSNVTVAVLIGRIYPAGSVTAPDGARCISLFGGLILDISQFTTQSVECSGAFGNRVAGHCVYPPALGEM
ncbi:MAG: hypothetical protein KJ749_06330, partial [Planctomycetes bacterium]|nr:hypothetical protein [Planctomycetota bacterium]